MMNKKELDVELMSARQCINFLGFECNNKDCKNKFCPLHKRFEKGEL